MTIVSVTAGPTCCIFATCVIMRGVDGVIKSITNTAHVQIANSDPKVLTRFSPGARILDASDIFVITVWNKVAESMEVSIRGDRDNWEFVFTGGFTSFHILQPARFPFVDYCKLLLPEETSLMIVDNITLKQQDGTMTIVIEDEGMDVSIRVPLESIKPSFYTALQQAANQDYFPGQIPE